MDTVGSAGGTALAVATGASTGDDAGERPLHRGVVAAGLTAGTVLRVAALSGTLGRTDSDEVLSGLMARHLTGDGWPVFLWGQGYGGTAQLGWITLSTTVFGSTSVGLRLPVVLVAVANTVLVWRVARRLLPARQAQVAGLLAWLGPPTALWYGVREMLFYQPTVLFGLVATLFVLRIIDPARDGGDRRDWVVLGLAAGLGWWTSPNVTYLAVPAALVLLVHRRRWWPSAGARAVLAGAVAAVAGALPWIVQNVTLGFVSFRTGGFPVYGNYVTRLGWFLWFGLPGALGARETFTYDWILGGAGLLLGAAGVVALVVAGRRGLPDRPWDVLALVTYPLLFAIVPFGPDQPNMKYQFFLTPILAIVLARLARSARAAAVLLALTVAVTAIGLSRIGAVADAGGTPLLMPDLDEAITVLDRHGVTAVWGDYWVVYRLDWHTEERIVAAPTVGLRRYRPYADAVRAAPRAAWVVERGRDEALVRQGLVDLAVPFVAEEAGAYVVVVPERPVLPEELDASDRIGR
jgi:4-amino-4-deoxy-L-arabinose transferase-like glycosyltransferase